ncbi:NB-ARC domain-containing protein [Rickettsiella endosymbiont of Xylota segnis]|uniref:NB-ARC domain-containing protein n=1 Tax=Rickettsiella endosymbiont of Xylota segnis TaxID=3066238 RepID=UPI0030D33383
MNKKNEKKNKNIYSKFILKSSENIQNLKTSNQLRVKRGNAETLAEATAKGEYNYWLNQDDLNEIVRLEYNTYAGIVGSNAKFAVLTSLSDLTNNLEVFLLKTKESAEARLTLIMQLESLHWVTLVISYNARNYIAYYTDSKNYPMPPEYYRLLFDQFKIQPMSLSPGFLQQTEDYNCGLWALENAVTINQMIIENQSMYWLINQLQLSRSKEFFETRRQFLSEKLRADPGWCKRHPMFTQEVNPQREPFPSSFRRIASTSLSRDDSKRLKLHLKDEKEQIIILLETFVETFMRSFSKNLGKYHLLAKGELLTEHALKTELKTGLTGALLGIGISQSLVGSIPSLVASLRMISGKYYESKDKAQKITKIFSKANPGSLSKLLSAAAVDIFYSYENQFMLVTDKAGDKIAMEKLAEDAVGRVFNYIAKSTEMDSVISEELIVQGVLQGPSEKLFDPSIKSARLRITGNIVQDKSGNNINTANLYEKVGLVILENGQPNKYFANKEHSASHRYGYRRILNWEQEVNGELKQSLQNQFSIEHYPQAESIFQFVSRGYNYILETDTNTAEAQRILDKIEHRNSPQSFKKEYYPSKMPILFDLRKPINNFSGRVELLKTLHQVLLSERTIAIVPSLSVLDISASPSSSSSQATSGSSFSITGLGGIGKTQLALRYAELYARDYDYNVLWISAETKENLAYSFHKLANKLELIITDSYGSKKDLEEIVDAVYEYFSDRKSLFIFDNVENYRAITNFLPKTMLGNKPTLLITSRYNNWENVASVLSLGVFTQQETEELIQKSLDLTDNTENEKIKELNQLLQGLPLALQQALAYIKLKKNTDVNFSIESYTKLYKEKCQFLLSFDFSNYNNDLYLQTVYTTWLITLEKIKSHSGGQDAIDTLYIMAYLDPDNISITKFYYLNHINCNLKLYDLDGIMHMLTSYSMINRGQENKYTIHRLLQQVIRINLEQDRPKFEEVIKKTQKLLVHFGFKDDEQNIFHYLHFLLYMSEHTDLESTFLYGHPEKIFFDNLSYQHIKYCSYFIDLAFLKFPRQKYLKFIGDAIAYYIKLGLSFFLAETLDYLEKKWLAGSLSKENIKYIIEHFNSLKDPKFKIRRLSSLPLKKEMQQESIKLFYEFKIKIFGDLFNGYDNCPAHSLKRSICSFETEDKIEDIKNLKIKSHLKKVASLTRTVSSGLMAKDTLSALLQGDFSKVAINVGLISSNTLFGKISSGLFSQGKNLAAETSLLEKDLSLESKSALRILFNKEVLSVGKRQLLGKTMQVASPFVARATSIFFVYNLKKEMQAYEVGDKALIPDIISNGIIVGVDGVEAGIEGAELIGVIAGVAELTGPIGEGITLLAWFGSEMYSSEQQVASINKYVSLSRTEQVVQFLRAFFQKEPSEYLQLKAKNEQLVKHAIPFLKVHTDIIWYIVPTFYTEKVLYNNSRVFLDVKRQLEFDDSTPNEPNEGHLFCLSGTIKGKPFSDFNIPSNCGCSYLCQNAIGIEYSAKRTGNATLIALGPGNQEVIAFVDSPTLFLVENGRKLYRGGNKVNVFNLQGNSTSGLLQGGQGWNILILDKFFPEKSDYLLLDFYGFLCGKNSSLLNYIPLFCSSGETKIQLKKINQISGRNKQQEIFYLDRNMREIDGNGGRNNEYPDIFLLNDRSYKHPKFILRNNTIIVFLLNSDVNSVDYLIPLKEVGVAQVKLHSEETIQHRFFFQTAIQNIQALSIKNRTINILLNPLDFDDTKTFNLTVSDSLTANNQTKNELIGAKNISYFFQNIEMKFLNNEQIYLQEKISNNKTIDENISFFTELANRLEKTFSLHLLNNSMISIGRATHEIFYINGLFESHLVGNGGENVYVILPCKDPVFPLAPITLYDSLKEDYKESREFRDTLDLRELVKKYRQIYPNAIIFPRLFRVGGDLFLTLINAIYSSSHYLHNLDGFHSLVTIQLKDGVLNNDNWYQKIDIFIDNLIPKNIRIFQDEENEIWKLVETPLVFTDDKQIIVITDKDIGEQAEIIILKNIGYFIFLHTETDLILSNIPTGASDVCTIILADFKMPEMKKKILSATFKFFDREFQLQDYQDKIEHATYFSDKVSTEDVTVTPSFLDLISPEKITSEHKESSQQKEWQRRKRQTVRENNIGINSNKTIPTNENKLSNLTFFPQNKPDSLLSKAFDEDRILRIADDYIKKYQDASSKKNTAWRVKKNVQKNNERQASPLISANKPHSEKKPTIYPKDRQNYHKQSIQKKSNFNLKKQKSPMPFAQHGLKSSVKSRTGNLAVNKNKFLKNTFLQDKKISLAASAASNSLNHKKGFKNTIKAQPRLGYQQSESKSQHKPNQYTTRLSRIDGLTNFNATLLLIQLMGKIRTPISHHSNPKLNKIFNKNQKQEDKIVSEFLAAQFNR